MRRPFVAGNWKMNSDKASAEALVAGIRSGLADASSIDVAICPPCPYLIPVVAAAEGSTIGVGAQNMYFEPEGAYTGEVSAKMLLDVGCTYAIIGHSERRHTIGKGETDDMLNTKVKAVLAAGLTPIFCIGELLKDRDADKTETVLDRQVRAGLAGISAADAAKIVVAYEPVWAIGTGRVATPAQAQDAHKFIRNLLAELYSQDVADAIRIQYGGSVKPDNAAELMGQPDVDGALVGGASLKADSFLGIIEGTIKANTLA